MIHIRFTLTQAAVVLLLGLGFRAAFASEETVSIQPPVVAAINADSTALETDTQPKWFGRNSQISMPQPCHIAGLAQFRLGTR